MKLGAFFGFSAIKDARERATLRPAKIAIDNRGYHPVPSLPFAEENDALRNRGKHAPGFWELRRKIAFAMPVGYHLTGADKDLRARMEVCLESTAQS